MGFEARYVAPMLSQYKIGGSGDITSSSRRSVCIQVNSAAVFAMALYSDSVLDRDTVGCFLELQDKMFLPRMTQYPEVERRSSGQLAQSESE
jgi:hypothetical protein